MDHIHLESGGTRADSQECLRAFKTSCLRCRGLRGAGLDADPAATVVDDDDDEECKPMLGPTSLPTCLSRSRDSFSARNRSSRFIIFFSKVLDIALARRGSSALLNAATCLFWFLFLFIFFFYIRRTPPPTPSSPGSPHRRHAPDI